MKTTCATTSLFVRTSPGESKPSKLFTQQESRLQDPCPQGRMLSCSLCPMNLHCMLVQNACKPQVLTIG